MSDNALRTYEVQLNEGYGARVFYGDEWSTDDGELRIWRDDLLVAEVAKGFWVYIQDETARVEAEVSLRSRVCDVTP